MTCPLNSFSPSTSEHLTDCICNAGYTGTIETATDVCAACSIGYYKPGNGTGACLACDINYYSDTLASTECISCVEFLNSDGAITLNDESDSSNDCKCDLSQTRTNTHTYIHTYIYIPR